MPTLPPARTPFGGRESHQAREIAESFGLDADRYDRARPRYPDALVDRIAAGAARSQHRHDVPDVLDVGCGTGIFADRLERDLAPGAVAGCDMSAGMLAEAAARSGRVTWVRGDSARLPFRPGAFDAVVCTMAFHFFDQPRAWAEFHRILTPGGHALVGMVHPRTAISSDRYSRMASAASKTKMIFPTAPDMRGLATAAGFDVIDQPQVDWRFHRIVPVLLTVARA